MTKKLLFLLYLYLLASVCNATSLSQVSESISLEFAQKNGLEFESHEFANLSGKKFNFSKFEICEAESVFSQTFDKKGNWIKKTYIRNEFKVKEVIRTIEYF